MEQLLILVFLRNIINYDYNNKCDFHQAIGMVTCVIFTVIQMEASTPASTQRLLTVSCISQRGTTMIR